MTERTDPTLGDARIDRLVAEVLAERAEDVYAAALSSGDMTERIAGRPRFAGLSQRGSLALLILIALLAAAAVSVFVAGSWLARNAHLGVAAQIIEAINSRDLDGLQSLLVEDASLEFPEVLANGRRTELMVMGEHSVGDGDGHRWMGEVDSWGMEAHLGRCREVDATTVTCAVVTRWPTLQLEIGEAWTFEFQGQHVSRLEMLRVDPDPTDRLLPLGLVDIDDWEAWLRETHPTQVDRLLNPGPYLFEQFYFAFGLDASPEEIGASINEYLKARP